MLVLMFVRAMEADTGNIYAPVLGESSVPATTRSCEGRRLPLGRAAMKRSLKKTTVFWEGGYRRISLYGFDTKEATVGDLRGPRFEATDIFLVTFCGG